MLKNKAFTSFPTVLLAGGAICSRLLKLFKLCFVYEMKIETTTLQEFCAVK